MNTTKPPRTTYLAEVVQIRDLSPAMRRISVASHALRALRIELPGQWMKTFFPAPDGVRPIGRAYTVRAFDQAAGQLDLDFVMHGDEGPAGHWVLNARLGDVLSLAGPRAGYVIDPHAGNHLLIGDATALPAIASIVQALPPQASADVLLEVAGPRERQELHGAARHRGTWLYSGAAPAGTSGQLLAAVRASRIDADSVRVWLAGESAMVRAVRQHLLIERGLPRAFLTSAGYWKLGDADHRERDEE
ncbi:siderophore-interacting protein [Rugamonas sp. CCM 8940]|uniref:siderophore-interacting protein n=1 Tax=Rugamonas sp. CCM 8940 TaxID=2765359 RepID=UPI0018F75EB0|nr:siderophore-interacting protein [Rugamonas sp. CCM 8940]MBJ7313045.1 siderophore-interacting protein [Rugamonas sp. CCM 8940]